MRRRVFTCFSAMSLVLCISIAAFWIASESRDWRDGSVPVAGRVRFWAAHGTIAVFNQSRPFFNGTVSMAARGSRSTWPKEISFRFPGFAFRRFTWPGNFPGGTYWTLAISFLYPLTATAILPGAWCVLWLRRRGNRDICPTCSYCLTGNVSGVCPECGTAIPSSATTAEMKSPDVRKLPCR